MGWARVSIFYYLPCSTFVYMCGRSEVVVIYCCSCLPSFIFYFTGILVVYWFYTRHKGYTWTD